MRPDAMYSPQRERALLGAAMLEREAAEILVGELEPGDFHDRGHQRIAEAARELHQVGLAVDPVTIAGWVADHYGAQALTDLGGLPALVAMQADCPASRSGPSYAATIKDRSGRRRLHRIYQDGLKALDDTGTPLEQLVEDASLAIQEVDFPTGAAKPPTLTEVMALDRPRDWQVHGMIERADRVMITSSESGGKSEMLLQWAVQMTAGIHPFALSRFAPLTVLMVDRENTISGLQLRLPRLISAVADRDYQHQLGQETPPEWDPDRLFLEVDDSPLDLTRRPDQRWLAARIEACRPDVVIVGPVYKLMPEVREKTEENATKLAWFVDRLRRRYRCTFIMEHHTPLATDSHGKRQLRPIGTSLWMRWVDTGYGFRPVQRERGDRDGPAEWEGQIWKGRDATKVWPKRLRHGKTWPWINAQLAEYDDPPF